MSHIPKGMTDEELLGLPVTVDMETAGRAFRMSRSTAYELARAVPPRFPCRVLPTSEYRFVVAKADLLKALGIDWNPSLATVAAALAPIFRDLGIDETPFFRALGIEGAHQPGTGEQAA